MRACGRAWDKVVSDASGYLKYIYISSSPSPPFYVIYFKRVGDAVFIFIIYKQIETFHVSVIVLNATIVVSGIVFGGIPPPSKVCDNRENK